MGMFVYPLANYGGAAYFILRTIENPEITKILSKVVCTTRVSADV